MDVTTTAEKTQNGIFFYDSPLKTDRYKFLYEHLDCDSIVKINEDANDRTLYVIACALQKEFNGELEDFFYSSDYSGEYAILRGIDSKEANSID